MSKIFEIKDNGKVNGVRILSIENYIGNDMSVWVSYPIPFNLDSSYSGLMHLYEHLAFSDMIDGIYTVNDMMTEAHNAGCSINASTSLENIIFKIDVDNLEISNSARKGGYGVGLFKELNRVEKGIKFFKKYLAGVLRPKRFTSSSFEREVEVVKSEISATDNIHHKVSDAISDLLYDYSLAGQSPSVIDKVTLEEMNIIAKSMNTPTIIVKYNPNVEYFEDAVRMIKDIVEDSYENKVHKLITVPSHRIATPINLELGTINDFNVHPEGFDFNNNLNVLSVAIPKDNTRSIEDLVYRQMVINYIFGLSNGSLCSYLREDLGVIYGFSGLGTINRKREYSIDMTYARISDRIKFSNKKSLTTLLKSIDTFILNMVAPDSDTMRTLLFSILSSRSDILMNGISIGTLVHMLNNEFTLDKINDNLYLDFDIDYKRFCKIFDEVKNSFKFTLL